MNWIIVSWSINIHSGSQRTGNFSHVLLYLDYEKQCTKCIIIDRLCMYTSVYNVYFSTTNSTLKTINIGIKKQTEKVPVRFLLEQMLKDQKIILTGKLNS